MDCQIHPRNLPLFKGLVLCMFLLCFVGQRSNSEAKSVIYDQVASFLKPESEVEVDDLQKFSSCKYVVRPFEISEHNGFPKKLYHIRCEKGEATKICHTEGGKNYTCMQTYKDIHLPNRHKPKRIFTGCVCACPDSNSTSPQKPEN